MRYIKSFSNADAIQAAVDNNTLGKPYVALNEATGEIDWNSKDKGPSAQYFTIEVISAGTVNLTLADGVNMQYSVDSGETWQNNASINAQPGDKIMYKGTNDTLMLNWRTSNFTTSTAYYKVYGNIMSLLYGDNFAGQTTLVSGNTFFGMFQDCSGLTNAENLILPATSVLGDSYKQMFYGCTSLTTAPATLPATTLASYCYSYMFSGCTSLTTTPELPATTLAQNCYESIFKGCASLTAAPALPATTLANSCYAGMFDGCTSLTQAPELPATTLADYCYYGMFYGCTSLNYIKCLATNISADYCTGSWLGNVAASGTFVRDASMTGWTTGNSGIPSGWTLEPPIVSYMGTWTEGAGTSESPYVFNITELDTDYWGNWVNIGTIKDAYYQGAGPADQGVMLRYVSAENYWEISIGEDAGGSDSWHDTFSEAKVAESEVQVGDSSDDAIIVTFDGTDQFNFSIGTLSSGTLTITTINPAHPEDCTSGLLA